MFHSPKKQQGSVIIVSVFVIVIMGMMAAMLNRTQWSNQDSHVREVNGTHAWLAATSITEEALTLIYPLNQSSAASSLCDNTDPKTILSLPIRYEQWCQEVESKCSKIGTLGEYDYFKVESSAQCGTGIHQVERQHEVWIRE
ncbi:MSHA biogenesis protein MshP [Vibrio astriarenae]|uniref:MSHA biogenesis protein MshP n=1 Tax=Vibrio astriarenae TaxID=1481923 RepID=UPI0037370D48